MVSPLFYYQLALLALLWLFVMVPLSWPRRSAPPPTAPATPIKSKHKRSTESKAFEGLTHKPHCALCEQEIGETPPAPPRRPDPMPLTNRRPRTVDTPTVCIYVTSLVASSCGYDDGKNGPTRCALIGAARGDR
jgi:hypothetical protein